MTTNDDHVVPVVSATLTEFIARERPTADPVFVVVDQAPDLTCPECDGVGCWWNAVRDFPDMPCKPCNGTGVSPVYAATWQQRISIGDAWSDWQEPFTEDGTVIALGDISHSERRQVVEWRATDVTVLPVFASGHPDEDSVRSYEVDEGGNVFDPDGWTVADDNGYPEPWAADLRPGQFVVRLSGWEHLDTPLTEQVLTWEKFDGVTDDGQMVNRRVVKTDRVPLSVPDGAITWIELA